jgi:cysteine-rich repeat protein
MGQAVLADTIERAVARGSALARAVLRVRYEASLEVAMAHPIRIFVPLILGILPLATAGCGSTCGDGAVENHAGEEFDEQCDDGNDESYDGCDSECRIEVGWTCSSPDGVLSFCRVWCGDGIVAQGEGCDDGNAENGDGCSERCQVENLDPECGDGIVDPGEECDDGDDSNTDSCLTDCTEQSCGDGYVWSGIEYCDDGNGSNTDACVDCGDASCGDGHVWAGVEECDDQNTADGDGCASSCIVEDLPMCAPVSTMSCNVIVQGIVPQMGRSVLDTSACTQSLPDGPEQIHQLVPVAATEATIYLSVQPGGEYVYGYVIPDDGTCAAAACLAFGMGGSMSTFTFPVTPGASYLVVVEGLGNYSVYADCT